MKRFFHLLPMICVLLCLPLITLAAERVTVFAAASLRDALEDVAFAFGGDIVLSYGGSGQIARQVAQGAPADVVILANAAWMDWLEKTTSGTAHDRLNLLGNRLVLISGKDEGPASELSPGLLLDKLAGGRLAMGQMQGVPAGIYGRQWLETTGFWPTIAPHIAETDNVRSVLALVARGEAPLGVVYATDAQADNNVAVFYEIPAETYDPIIYPAAIIDRNAIQAAEFFTFLKSAAASDIFRLHGFEPLGEAR